MDTMAKEEDKKLYQVFVPPATVCEIHTGGCLCVSHYTAVGEIIKTLRRRAAVVCCVGLTAAQGATPVPNHRDEGVSRQRSM